MWVIYYPFCSPTRDGFCNRRNPAHRVCEPCNRSRSLGARANRCEYCRIPYPYYRLPFQIDHIIARQHRGPASLDNLALACFHCNRHKGPNIAGWDPGSEEIVRLFHPRNDSWSDHFRFAGPALIAITAIGRVTAQVLAINDSDVVAVRYALIQEGVFRPDD